MCATGESVPVGALADLEARVAAAVGLDALSAAVEAYSASARPKLN